MNIHKNARLTPIGRERLVRQMLSGLAPEAAARAVGVSPRTAYKWLARFKNEGVYGLADRSSRPHKLNNPTPADVTEWIVALRRKRFTGKHIARLTDVSSATVSRILRKLDLPRFSSVSLNRIMSIKENDYGTWPHRRIPPRGFPYCFDERAYA